MLRRRRMVRDFEDRPLARGAADRIAAAAMRAPSAGFAQGTELLVLEEADDRERFWEAVVDPGYRERMPWPGLLRAPLVVVVFGRRAAYEARYAEPDKAGRSAPPGEQPWWLVDASFAAMLLLLAAVDEGLGALFFAVRRPEGLRQAFGVPESFVPLGAVAVGHPRPHRPSTSLARRRRPLSETIHRGQW